MGNILSANFIPYKYCDYNCVYCGVGPTTDKVIEREEFYPPKEVFAEIREFLSQNDSIDYVWMTGIGEPTLYSGFKELNELIKQNFPNVKTGLNTNGALFHREDVRNDFLGCDVILVSFSSVFQEEFEQICRPHQALKVEGIIEGIKLFRKEFKNKFGIVSFLINGINDNERSALGLKKFINNLNLDYLVFYNYECRGYGPISLGFKVSLKELYENPPFELIFKF